jgi:hypothetical protein
MNTIVVAEESTRRLRQLAGIRAYQLNYFALQVGVVSYAVGAYVNGSVAGRPRKHVQVSLRDDVESHRLIMRAEEIELPAGPVWYARGSFCQTPEPPFSDTS